MSTIWIPTPLQDLTGGCERLVVTGTNVGDLVDSLECRFPGIRARLCDGAELRTGMAVSIDGEVSPEGLRAMVGQDSEVHFVPAISGG